MELIQKAIRYQQEGRRTFDQFYIDEEYNVPDSKEDIQEIVYGKGNIKIEDMKLIENYVRISGKLYFQILYMTAQSDSTASVLEGKIPFEEMVYTDSQQNEQYFIQNTRIEFGANLVHSRKVSIRTMVELELGREQLREENTTVDLECEQSIFKKMRTVNLLKLHTSKNDTYRIKEELTLSGTKESIGQILLTNVTSRKLEIRTSTDALLLRGELSVFCMYLSEEGKADWIEQNLPYEGRVECSGAEDEMYYHIHSSLEDAVIDVRMDEDGEMRILGIEGTLCLRIHLYEEEEMELLEDMYSLEKKVDFTTREAIYEELELQKYSKHKVMESLALPELKEDVLQICYSDGSVQVERTEIRDKNHPEGSGIFIEGILHVTFLYLKSDDQMPFGSWQGMIPFSYVIDCPQMSEEMQYQLSYHVEQLSITMTGSESVDVKAIVAFDLFLRKAIKMQVITEVSLSEIPTKELEKRPGIVGYIVKSGDDLWSLAKRYMTTEDRMKEMNHLETEILKPGEKLIISR